MIISRQKTGGRVAGTPNKRTQDLLERLEALGVDPLTGLAEIAKDLTAPLELRAKVMTDLLAYIYPKRKALEMNTEAQKPVSIRIGINFEPDKTQQPLEVLDCA